MFASEGDLANGCNRPGNVDVEAIGQSLHIDGRRRMAIGLPDGNRCKRPTEDAVHETIR